ncbi:hypothetical protein KQX54_005618 [Cotesia glomerata]|uniref:Uncharacterized protein n=1 Tax=Cotesia glomerata TaxID=32391 RepID=A0AAV7HZF3_COTGL|nr:hypothetical protein KQX54_005618 [Cotesia glomerata]
MHISQPERNIQVRRGRRVKEEEEHPNGSCLVDCNVLIIASKSRKSIGQSREKCGCTRAYQQVAPVVATLQKALLLHANRECVLSKGERDNEEVSNMHVPAGSGHCITDPRYHQSYHLNIPTSP